MTEQPKNDGGPAFPHPKQQIDSVEMEGHVEVIFGHPGMSLRDWLAGQALASGKLNYSSIRHNAEEAYKYADAMLEARDADN